MYSVRKLSRCNIAKLKTVSDILYECGKDMAKKYDLHHWNNSHIKNYVIVALCALKNDIYLVYNEKHLWRHFKHGKRNNHFCFKS